MFLLGSPIIGDGFLKNRNPSWIRHGENNYQYRAGDEVHKQGQAWMGFAWKLRQALIVGLGEAAGTALAETLVVPVLLSKATEIPAAMAQVLLNDMDKEGNIPHEAKIRAAAKAHGVELPKNPGIVTGLWEAAAWAARWAVSPLSGVAVTELTSQVSTFRSVITLPLAAEGLQDSSAVVERPDGATRRTLALSAGPLSRERILLEISRCLQFRPGEHELEGYSPLRWEIKENWGFLSSKIIISLQGSKETVDYIIKQIQRLSGN
jgi:hypothetical protein